MILSDPSQDDNVLVGGIESLARWGPSTAWMRMVGTHNSRVCCHGNPARLFSLSSPFSPENLVSGT